MVNEGARLTAIGRYRILGELGRGAMGVVYRAEDTRIGRLVALKAVPIPHSGGPPQEHEAYARFLREARAAGRLTHPNIVTVFDVGEDQATGMSYIAMEFVNGETLEQVMRRRDKLSFAQIRAIGMQVAAALQEAHDAGVIHRDIKPGNIILTAGGETKITDFGVAKIADAAMTHDGTLLGSPGYMSPEQVKAGEIDHRSDLFSLGVVLYELVTLRPAFSGKNVYEVIHRVASVDLPPPRAVRPEIPRALETVILRALQRDRNGRFRTAAEMKKALETSAEARSVEGRDGTRNLKSLDPTATIAMPASLRRAPEQARSAQGAVGARAPRWLVWGGLATLLAGGGVGLRLIAGGATPAATTEVAMAETPAPGPEETPIEAAIEEGRPGDPGEPGAGGEGAAAAGEGQDAPARERVAEPIGSASPDPAADLSREPAVVAAAEMGRPNGDPIAPDPGPTPRRSTPRPATPTPTPVISSATTSAASGSLPYSIPARHQHGLGGGCGGWLFVYETGVVYDASTHDKDDRSWSYRELSDLKIQGAEVEFRDRERRFRFEFVRDRMPDEARALLGRMISAAE